MRALIAAWRVSLARTRADWPIVGAAWLITLLAAVLFSAGLIYPSSSAEAGLRRALDDAPLGTTNIDAALYAPPAGALDLDAKVQAQLQGAISDLGGSIVRDWRSSATLALTDLPGAVAGDQGVIGYLDGVADHASLVAGAWPTDRASELEPIQVVLLTARRRTSDLGRRRRPPVAHPSVNRSPCRLASSASTP